MPATPKPVDYAYIAVSGAQIPDMLKVASGRVRFAQVISSGFGEVDEGKDLQARLLAAAREGGMRLIGHLLELLTHVLLLQFRGKISLHFIERFHAGGFFAHHLNDVIAVLRRDDVADVLRFCGEHELFKLRHRLAADNKSKVSALYRRARILRVRLRKCGEIAAGLHLLQQVLRLG